ncbi:hypothetical protein JX266_012252 [Neoarthrinium moseri]|nr:hypothetical protein JX266_012252 [Neoarthrinium moseri]
MSDASGTAKAQIETDIKGTRSSVETTSKREVLPAENKLVDENGEIYLVPTPTTDKGDPLNWHPARKWAILAILMLWSSAALSIQAFLLNYIPSVAERFPDADAGQINLLVTIIMPMIAPGQLIFTPLAIAYGRRFSMLLANALLFASCIWGAFSTSYNSLLAARVVEGLAAGPTDCLVYVIVQEMSFVHERGTMIGALMGTQLALQLGLSIATNYMAVTTSFQAPFFMFAAISAFTLVGMFFIMPEVRYNRDGNSLLPRIKLSEYASFKKTLGTSGEYKPFTLARQLQPISPRVKGSPNHSVVWFFKRMGVYALSPIMWWNAGLNTIMCGSLLAASTYYAIMLVSEPWSWAPQNVGLINIGPVLMAALNWVLLGWGNDKVIFWLAKRNNGVNRPEHRLVVLIIPVITGIISSIGFGALAQDYLITNPGGDQPHWFSIVFLMSLYYQSFCGILEATLIYLANITSAEDSLAVMTLVAVIRDSASFGMGYGVVGFAESVGYLTSFSIYGMLTGVLGILGIPVYLYADRFRTKAGVAV